MTSSPTQGLPHFLITGHMNDLLFVKYDSDINSAQFMFPSLNVLSGHLEMLTNLGHRWQVSQERKMTFLMEFLNKTSDTGTIHVYQRRNACELHEDGTVGGYVEFALDGEVVITLDREKGVFVPEIQEAVTLIPEWSKDLCCAMWNKMYMENDCISYIKLYLPLIANNLEKKIKPNVKISSSESESGIKLHCWVYGFYPRDVEVKWIKNGRDEIYSEESAEILPNPDGTYQIRVSVEVTPEEGATYSCHVDHSSLEKTKVVPFERETKKSHIIYTIVAVAAAALLVIIGPGVYIKRKINGCECSRQSVSTEEQD
ncbi:hypothetical protein XELAEV_18040588mg [Xenopus laevis]|nr:hypothetical protein XELAEV_18040588mg [Xenopus laevis]